MRSTTVPGPTRRARELVAPLVAEHGYERIEQLLFAAVGTGRPVAELVRPLRSSAGS